MMLHCESWSGAISAASSGEVISLSEWPVAANEWRPSGLYSLDTRWPFTGYSLSGSLAKEYRSETP